MLIGVRDSADNITAMKTALETLRQQMAADTEYFRHVYNYTFEFSRPPGQRSLGARAGVVARGAAAD